MRRAFVLLFAAFFLLPVGLPSADPVWVSRDEKGHLEGVFMQKQSFPVERADTEDEDVKAFLERKPEPDTVPVQEQLEALWEIAEPGEGTDAASVKAKVLKAKQAREKEKEGE